MSGVGSSPTSVYDTSQILLAGLPDGFSRESPVFFCVCFIFFIYLFIFFHTREGDNTTTLYTSQAKVCTERQTLHRMHCAFDEMVFTLNN